MDRSHRANVLVTSCLKTPVDPRTKVPLALYERARAAPVITDGEQVSSVRHFRFKFSDRILSFLKMKYKNENVSVTWLIKGSIRVCFFKQNVLVKRICKMCRTLLINNVLWNWYVAEKTLLEKWLPVRNASLRLNGHPISHFIGILQATVDPGGGVLWTLVGRVKDIWYITNLTIRAVMWRGGRLILPTAPLIHDFMLTVLHVLNTLKY